MKKFTTQKYQENINEFSTKITFFTPTFNRAKYLKRIYEGLKTQTCNDFVWIIVNDGSQDNTEEIVESIIELNDLPILYISKPNGGKHSAFEIALQNCETKYFQCLDDDDIYDSESVEFYLKEWQKIENEGRDDIGAIRTIAKRRDGSYVSNKKDEIITGDKEDCTTLEMNYVRKHNQENWTCYKTSALKDIDLFPHGYWLENRHKFFMETIWQGRFARKYKCRYIYKSLRIYTDDAETSLIRAKKDPQYYVNLFINSRFLLEDQYDYIKKDKIILLKKIGIIQLLRGYLNISLKDLLNNTSNSTIKKFFKFSFPISCFWRLYIK